MLYPEVQERIHKELDERIGGGRIPTANEIESFEYLNAAWKESMRLNATSPLGIFNPLCRSQDSDKASQLPHTSIPKLTFGMSIIFPNVVPSTATLGPYISL
jgi:hypothetical protein